MKVVPWRRKCCGGGREETEEVEPKRLETWRMKSGAMEEQHVEEGG